MKERTNSVCVPSPVATYAMASPVGAIARAGPAFSLRPVAGSISVGRDAQAVGAASSPTTTRSNPRNCRNATSVVTRRWPPARAYAAR